MLVALFVVGFSWLAGTKPPVEAAVTLVSFEVERVSTPTNLKVKWETETELDVVGFRVKRSTTNNIAQAVTAATVPSSGSATRGAVYETLDTGGDAGLTTGQTYFYWLYELKSDGSEALVTETPKSQSPGVPIPPTNTPLATATTPPYRYPYPAGAYEHVRRSKDAYQHADSAPGCESDGDAHDGSSPGHSNFYRSSPDHRHSHQRCAYSPADQHIHPDRADVGDQHTGSCCSSCYRRGGHTH